MSRTVLVTMPEQEGSKSVVEKWLKAPGDLVGIHEPIVEISTDKVTIEIASPATGELYKIFKEENSEVMPGEKLAEILLFGEPTVRTPTSPLQKIQREFEKKEQQQESQESQDSKTLLSPAVRKLIRKNNIDVSKIHGTGKKGRVTHKDVIAYIKMSETHRIQEPPMRPSETLSTMKSKNVRPTTKLNVQEPPQPSDSKFVPHSPMRKQIANHMVQSMLQTAPHVTAIFEANMTNVIAHRNENKQAFSEQGVKLTFTSYFAMATALAAQAVPEVNSRWHDDRLEIFPHCNVGIATAVDNGLIVPVLKNVQHLSLIGIANELQKITQKAREGNLGGQDIQGGTLTITNHGVSGSLIATPIINQPQSAILGIGKMQKRVVVNEINGQDCIQIQPMIYVTLTIDHRALDGFQANKFLTAFVNILENWQ
ncbi:dihydrolipoamide acetyltransferase family protein [Candidatus Uabimicrobium amorphum]|uniref:Dihydrolipoamide acetyltransferase component of pyruvate dehydrogenase complex n=1 Tax=Uabimicrobium amorphum TaxID=2596890 RepID=A0A5S9F3Y3_UABAM|nr:2-oxo acid dehydrogenase subunit E2 [Candidatus Uabimicrobium amorphum]BBM84633.1 dihydrolipoamide acetyltransferase component of pyruvate dehydrogenase complex [Candidatus Uabimicrobium amorphum]